MSSVCPDNVLQSELQNKQIKSASSSLKRFVVCFADNTALLLEAVGDGSCPEVRASMLSASEIEAENEAVCRVDWGWITGSRIISIACSTDSFAFQLDPAGPLRISVQLWQDSPFLAFRPFRSA